MKSRKNLTRFTYERAAFMGWRYCRVIQGTSLVQYFSDREYGGVKKSLAAAEEAKAFVKGVVGKHGGLTPSARKAIKDRYPKMLSAVSKHQKAALRRRRKTVVA